MGFIRVIAVQLVGSEHLQHIEVLRWVETSKAGSSIALTQPEDTERLEMYNFVKAHPRTVYALNAKGDDWAFLEAVDGSVKYVKTVPDRTKSDNLLSLPRF